MDEKKLQEIKEAMIEHKRKLEIDPAYRNRCEKIEKLLEEYLPNFGNDTID